MADKKSDSKKGKPSGAGRRKGKFDGFFSRVPERKLRRVLKSSGQKAARAYAQAHGLLPELKKLDGSGLMARREVAREHRRVAREVRLNKRHEFRLARRQARIAQQTADWAANEKKAKRSAAAKKAAATRKAKTVAIKVATETSA